MSFTNNFKIIVAFITNVAKPTPFEPKSFTETAVIMELNKIFTSSLATRRVFMSNSFFSRSFPTRTARRFFSFFRIISRSLFIERKELSEILKSIERTTRITEIISNPTSIASLNFIIRRKFLNQQKPLYLRILR